MGTGLILFAFNTLRKRMNDPANKAYWLPKRLQAAEASGGGKLLPLRQAGWDVGPLADSSGTALRRIIKDQWWMAVRQELAEKKDPKLKEIGSHQAIACPNAPSPRLAMPAVTVHGLDNAWLADNPGVTPSAGGYRTKVTLQIGHYRKENARGLAQLAFEGRYSLKQCVCSAGKEGTSKGCDGWVPQADIDGVGDFKATLTDVSVDVLLELQVSGDGHRRTLQASVQEITLRGPAERMPGLSVDELTIQASWDEDQVKLWVHSAKLALRQPSTVKGFVANLNTTLNQPGHRERFAGLFTQQLNQALDDILGKVPPGELPSGIGQPVPNPVDQYLFDRVRLALSHPASSAYLPRTVYGFASPPLEPFQVGQISLGNGEHAGIQLEDLRVTQARVTGISNIKAPGELLVFRPAVIDAVLALSRLEPAPQVTIERDGSQKTVQVPAPPLQVAGDFAMNVEGEDEPYTGRFTLTLRESNVLASLEVSGSELEELQITFKRLEIESPLDKTSIEVDINSEFKDVVNRLINQDAFKRKALQGVNERAAQSLGAISQTATANARKIVAARLDG